MGKSSAKYWVGSQDRIYPGSRNSKQVAKVSQAKDVATHQATSGPEPENPNPEPQNATESRDEIAALEPSAEGSRGVI